jgi:ribose-phosphate pyrophosphokinase
MTAGLSVHGFPDSAAAADALAGLLDAPSRPIALRRFPDAESLVTAPEAAATALLVRPLDDPNPKLIEVMLASAALRDRGAARVILVAAYLPYMRQDMAFAPGQAVSQRVIGRFLANQFDGVVTAAPHLHRTPTLEAVFPGIRAAEVDLVPPLAALVGAGAGTVLIGPDEESGPLVAALGRAVGAPALVAAKVRHGDRNVTMRLPDGTSLAGRRAVLVDDVISSGTTLCVCAGLALAAGAARVEAVACHALHDAAGAAAMTSAGIARVASADGVPHPSNATALAPGLADAVRRLL